MRLTIQAKPNSKKVGIEKLSEAEWIIKISEQPQDGKANKAIILAISKELKIPKTKITIARGLSSRTKIVEIED